MSGSWHCTIYSRRPGERGSILLVALVVTLLTTVVILTAAHESGLRLVARQEARDGSLALAAAQAGIESAARLTAGTANWHNGLGGGAWLDGKAIGEARVTVSASDPADDLIPSDGASGSSTADTVLFKATAQVHNVRRALAACYVPLPHAALRNVVFSETLLHLDRVAVEGRLRASGEVLEIGASSLHGDITTLEGETVSPDLDDGDTDVFYVVDALDLPEIDFDWFVQAGEQIVLPYNNLILNTTITALGNPLGLESAAGIYWIDAHGEDVYFYNVGVIACIAILDADRVTVGWSGSYTTTYYHHSPDPDRLPALLVEGDLTMKIEGGGSLPIPTEEGVAMLGSDLEGVFACTGVFWGPQVYADEPLEFNGAILAHEAHVSGPGTLLRHLPALNENPLVELTQPGLRLVAGSIREP